MLQGQAPMLELGLGRSHTRTAVSRVLVAQEALGKMQ